MDREEALARHLCREVVTKIGEEAFRSGILRPEQVAAATEATLRTVDRLWPDYLPEARSIIAEEDRHG